MLLEKTAQNRKNQQHGHEYRSSREKEERNRPSQEKEVEASITSR
jgi:hypothetical protein